MILAKISSRENGNKLLTDEGFTQQDISANGKAHYD